MPQKSTGDDPPTVLLVEDEPDLAELFALWLRDTYTVKIANDCATAYNMLDETVDVVLLDRQLPDGSGDELLTAIQSWELGCRVAMVTAVEPDFDIIEMGFDDYLCKPAMKDELTDLVERLVDQATDGDGLTESYALASKMAILETHCSAAELAANEEYAELQARFETLQQELSTDVGEVTDSQSRAEYARLSARTD